MRTALKVSFIVLVSMPILSANIIHVPIDTSTIQGGINLANDGDTVLVAENIYYENINFRGKAITVASQFIMDGDTSHISKTIIDGSQPSDPDSGSVVYIISGEDSTSILSGFTITHGTGTIFTYYDEIDEFNRILKEGGGILVDSSGATIRFNYIKHNTLTNYNYVDGAGIGAWFILKGKSLIIEDNTISYNWIDAPRISSNGGISIVNVDGTCIIRRNRITHNKVTVANDFKAVGGGIGYSGFLNDDGKVIISENIITYNELHCKYAYGAGIYILYWETYEPVQDHHPEPLIYNNIISNNYSQDAGAGIGIWYGHMGEPEYFDMSPHPILINNTIVGNKSARGSGMYIWNGSVLLMNNILWDDLSSPQGSEIDMGIGGHSSWDRYPNDKNEIYMYNSDIQGDWEGSGNLDNYPTFKDTSHGDYSLTDYSVCVGRGEDSVLVEDTWYFSPVTDYYGSVRPNPIDELVDIGAIESEFPITKLEEMKGTYIKRYALSQNYPNPFNPSTTIDFTLPKTEFVTLKIFNIIGEKISTLVNHKLQAGNHTYQIEGSKLASGIYLYIIEAGDFQDVKKMILIK